MTAVSEEKKLMNLLSEIKLQLSMSDPTPNIKKLLRNLLEKGNVFEEPKSSPAGGAASPKEKSKKKKYESSGECIICGMERAGQFLRRGFKCNSCIGQETVVRPVGLSRYHVPSTDSSPSFDFHTPSSDEAPTDEPVIRAQSEAPKPLHRYMVFRMSGGIGDLVPKLRPLNHPCFLYNFALCRDAKRDMINIIHESAVPLDARGVLLGPKPNFELVKQVASAALIAMMFLKDNGLTHNGMQPQHFFVNALHSVKLLLAPFSPVMLPPPFAAPEGLKAPSSPKLEPSSPSSPTTVPSFDSAAAARDIYALGITLSIVAYGAPLAFPSLSECSGEEVLMVQYLHKFVTSDPKERITAEDALADPYLSTVRVVNGVPIESIVTSIIPYDQATGADPLEGQNPANAVAFVSNKSNNEAVKILQAFFLEQGPEFQIIRTSTHATIYSVKNDPRRRARSRAVSFAEAAAKSKDPNHDNAAAEDGLPHILSTLSVASSAGGGSLTSTQ